MEAMPRPVIVPPVPSAITVGPRVPTMKTPIPTMRIAMARLAYVTGRS